MERRRGGSRSADEGEHLTSAPSRLRAIFAGTADFSVPSLRATAEHCDLVAVITQPDRPGHRGRKAPRPVADAAIELGAPLLQPARLRDDAAIEEILKLTADVLVVAAYGQIVPAALLDGHRLGGVNVHASLLPRWRGASPIAAAILAGDAMTGVCIMQMEPTLDTGPVYAQLAIPIDADATLTSLSAALAQQGASLLGGVMPELAAGSATPAPQDEALATYAPLLHRRDGVVDWTQKSALTVDRMVRALNPWPGVRAPIGGVEVAIVAGGAVDWAAAQGSQPGDVVARATDTIDVKTADGVFRVETVVPPGSRAMSAAAFLRGRRL